MQIQTNRSLSEFSTFEIGGPARFLTEVRSVEEGKEAYAWAKERSLPILIVGKGSNCLFSDAPYPGLVLINKIDFCTIQETKIHVGSGASFALLGVHTARQNLSGLEFASGIPATVGGAVFMNAGANGQETCNSLSRVIFLHESGEEQQFTRNELDFGYRTSPFQTMRGFIVAASFELTEKFDARKSQLQLIEQRMKTQPLKDKSAGCVFRNPSKEVSAGALIDRCGLKGASVGGAAVSTTHANFLINCGGATQRDVLELMRLIQERVFSETGIQLQSEVKIFYE